ncbi:hypothetical protein, partial [Vibrio parahaemolyticus]|uniref:hypothetical protein n=1 Tax=Vibrio parahaemolyticus TaxID=670 RepID=UPI000A9220A5
MAHKKKRSQFDIMHPLYDAIAEQNLPPPQVHFFLPSLKSWDVKGFFYPSSNTLNALQKCSVTPLSE